MRRDLLAVVLALMAAPLACERSETPTGPRAPLTGTTNVFGKSFETEAAAPSAGEVDSDRFRRERAALVASIQRAEGLSDRVVQAMLQVPRHVFVPEDQLYRAYDDNPLTIGHGQTISQPTVVAMMTEALDVRGDEVVLEIGTGSGYQAAVLSRLVKRVETIEIVAPLAERAEKALKRMGYDNVFVHVGDGYAGLVDKAPFDRIIITAAPPQIPPRLVEQLATGGRMVLPVGPRFGVQDLIVIEKRSDGTLGRTNLGPVRFVPMVRGDED